MRLKGKRIAILAESMYQEMEGRAFHPPDQRVGINPLSACDAQAGAPTDLE